MVLSLRSSWDVSIEGMVPDIERSRGIVDEERDRGGWEKARDPAVVSSEHARDYHITSGRPSPTNFTHELIAGPNHHV